MAETLGLFQAPVKQRSKQGEIAKTKSGGQDKVRVLLRWRGGLWQPLAPQTDCRGPRQQA